MADTTKKGFTGFNTSSFKTEKFRGAGTTANPYKYREDYGVRASKEGYEGLEKQKGEYHSALATYKKAATDQINAAKGTYGSQKTQFEADIKRNQEKLNQAKSQLGTKPVMSTFFNSWYTSQPKINVRVANSQTGQIEATYQSLRSVVESYDKSGSTGSGFMGFVDGGRNYNIETKQPKGYGGGAYAHNVARGLSDKNSIAKTFAESDNAKRSLAQAMGQWDKGNVAISNAQGDFDTSVANSSGALSNMNTSILSAEAARDNQVKLADSKRAGELDALRQNYLDARARRQQGYKATMSMAYDKGKGEK